jgi:hypothetical protein
LLFGEDRRAFIGSVGAGIFASSLLSVQPANALGGGLNKINERLVGLGLPTLTKVPDGFSPLLYLYGQGNNRFPLLVQFNHPFDWVVTTPSNDKNSEAGTIQAGEYARGDTATLFVYTDLGHVDDISKKDKKFFEEVLIKAISQKGNNLYQNFKVTNLELKTGEHKNQEYVIVDFNYELLTGAGFIVDRSGIASVTSQGDAVEVLWTASIRARYRSKTQPQLRTIANSFRCYADGLNYVAPPQAEM